MLARRNRLLLALALAVAAAPALGNIFGVDRRVEIASRASALRAIGLVVQRNASDRELESCTGTLVGARLVLTAAHCVGLKNGKLDPGIKTVFLPSVIAGQPPPGTETTFAVDVWSGEWRTEADSRRGDWAVLLLNRAPFSRELSSFGYLPVIAAPLHAGSRVASVGYSSDRDGGESPTADLHCQVRAVLSDGVFHHDCDVYAGASGGPILEWKGSEPDPQVEIVGVHNAHKSLGTAGLRLAHYRADRANLGTSADNFVTVLNLLKARYAELPLAHFTPNMALEPHHSLE